MAKITPSWAVTLVPLIVYLIGMGLRAIHYEMTPELDQAFQSMILFFITSASVGTAKSIAKLKKTG